MLGSLWSPQRQQVILCKMWFQWMPDTNVVSSQAKHIDLHYHFIWEHVSAGTIIINWIPTNDTTADIFTKALSQPLHMHHTASLGLTTGEECPTNQNQLTQAWNPSTHLHPLRLALGGCVDLLRIIRLQGPSRDGLFIYSYFIAGLQSVLSCTEDS